VKNIIVFSLALVSLVLNVTGCGRPHELSDAKSCTLTTAGKTFTYSFRIFQDGIAESKCNVSDSPTPAGYSRHVFEGSDGERVNYFCVSIVGDNTLSAPYWTFHRADDGSYATAVYSASGQPEQTLTCASAN
jgi:hypothetical protein